MSGVVVANLAVYDAHLSMIGNCAGGRTRVIASNRIYQCGCAVIEDGAEKALCAPDCEVLKRQSDNSARIASQLHR